MFNYIIENHSDKLETKYIIYKITNNINNKIYIGQTFTSIKERIRKHISDSLYNPRCLIDRSILKYGWENFKYEIIDYTNSLDELNDKEIYWINFYDSLIPIGYNVSGGGRNHVTSEETKDKLRKINLGKIVTEKTKEKIRKSTIGEKNHFYGKTHSEEAKLKMSIYHKNKIISEESKLKMSNSQKGRKHTPDTLLKMKLSALKRPKMVKPIIVLDIDSKFIKEVVNIHECSLFVGSCVRNIYDAINNHRLLKGNYHVTYKD